MNAITIIRLENAVARNPQLQLNKPVNFSLTSDEHIAIIGRNGAGKSLLVDTIMGKYPLKQGNPVYDFSPFPGNKVYDNIKYITFRDTYGSADANYYYQQRWNSVGQDETPTVRERLGEVKDEKLYRKLVGLFDILPLIEKKIVLLSSGELRKFQLIKALVTNPRVLIIDNPFIGLDVDTRQLLQVLLKELSTLEQLRLILVVSREEDIPEFITHVVTVKNKEVAQKQTLKNYLASIHMEAKVSFAEEIKQKITELSTGKNKFHSEEIIKLNHVNISYGDRTILKDINWTVRRGEKWALSGANGSGKSTLLSLVYADNPQSYARDIYLFGRKRGTGESIWEIKKRIGYVSPEMHRAYLKNIPAIEIVASGLYDTIGLYKRPQPEQLKICERWMELFGISELKDKPFLQLSSGEQRLALLARAFVKDPELLILDEPLHGLDNLNRLRVRTIIESFCQRKDKTMIMVTHYQEELPSMINQYLYLKKNN